MDAVVFDLDGTLVDSRADITACLQQVRLAFGVSGNAPTELNGLIGRPLTEILAAILPPALHPRIPEGIAVYRRYYHDHCADQSRLYPGVRECLDALAQIPLAVATNKPATAAEHLLSLLGVRDRFTVIQGADYLPPKPDPALLIALLTKLKVAPARSWMIGDTPYDVEAGKRAGMRTCAVTYGFGHPDELRRSQPDLLLETLAEFPRKR